MTDAEKLAFEAGYKAAAPRGHNQEHLEGCLQMDLRLYEADGHEKFMKDLDSGMFLFGPGPVR